MKVLLFANTDWYLYNFRLALIHRLRSAGVDVVLVSPSGSYGPRLRQLGYRWIELPMERRSLNPLREARVVRSLLSVYRDEAPTLVHHFTLKCVIYGSLAARAVGVDACVNAVAGLGYVFSSDAALSRAIRPVLKQAFRRVLHSDRMRLIVQNPSDLHFLISQELVDANCVRLIRGSGVNVDRFRPRERANCPTGKNARVLLATRLLWSKGVAEFVDAAKQLARDGVAAHFLLAGSPDDGNPESVPLEYLDQCRQEGLITPLGQIETMARLLDEVDIVVLPTTYGEGVPRILLEAAACGLPIVATDVPGCREIVEHGHNGLLIRPRDTAALAQAIRWLVENPHERLAMGRAGRQKATMEFDENAVIDETLHVYQEIVPPAELVNLPV